MKIRHLSLFKSVVCSSYASACKPLLLLLLFTGMGILTYAQRVQRERLDPRKDKLEYQGYIIRPIPAQGGSLGYDIFKDNKRLVHQYQPAIRSKRLYNKQDVYKVAQWAIAQYAKTNKFPSAVPPTAVKALHLSSTN